MTDRRRLTPEAPFDVARRRLLDQARWAAASRVDLIQVRERDLEAAPLAALVTDLLLVCAGSGTRVVVNDRLDVALACGAQGVHLRHDSVPAGRVRSIVPPGFLIGRSVHSAAEAAQAGPVDYLIAGTVYPTPSKPTIPTIGLRGLAEIVQAATVPVLAIGGLTADGLDAVAATGAAGVAGIGLFIDWFDTHEAAS
ncbi:MAG TPA: thiamine phosphate synthase [Vicinamibacterales bacterium]|nr:thiamine phosphate synthase [Vicinamibacterales bacterium]